LLFLSDEEIPVIAASRRFVLSENFWKSCRQTKKLFLASKCSSQMLQSDSNHCWCFCQWKWKWI